MATGAASQVLVRDRAPVSAPEPAAEQLWADLSAPLWSRVMAPAASIGADVPFLGILPIPDRPYVQRTNAGSFFFVSSYLDDPGLRRDGRIAIPKDHLLRLQQLRTAGVSVDEIWIGHQLPESWREGDAVPTLVPSPPLYRELDASMGHVIATGVAALGQAIRVGATTLLSVAGAVATGVAGSVASVGTDPIILGGIRHPEHRSAAWVLLAKWDWP
jgi:hypothetical protein